MTDLRAQLAHVEGLTEQELRFLCDGWYADVREVLASALTKIMAAGPSPTVPLADVSPALVQALWRLGAEYGPRGVAETAAQLCAVAEPEPLDPPVETPAEPIYVLSDNDTRINRSHDMQELVITVPRRGPWLAECMNRNPHPDDLPPKPVEDRYYAQGSNICDRENFGLAFTTLENDDLAVAQAKYWSEHGRPGVE